MPTEKPRVTITMSEDEFEKINDYRFEKKFKNQTQAILSLIDRGFSVTSPNTRDEFSLLSREEKKLLEIYRSMNREGREIVNNTAVGLSASGQYKKETVTVFKADHSVNNTEPEVIEMPVEVMKKLREAKSVDEI